MANRIQLSETNLNKLIKTIINEKKQLLNELWVCGDGPAVGSSCGRHGNGAICERFGTMAGYCYCDHTGSCPAESIGPGGRVPTQDNSIRPVSKRPIDNDMARIPHRTLGEQTIQLKESELTRLIKRVIIQEQTPVINNMCDLCTVWYSFNPGGVQQNCMCPTCACGTNPQTGPNTSDCEICAQWYSFNPGSVQDNCNCPTCPCSTSTIDKPSWGKDKYIDTDFRPQGYGKNNIKRNRTNKTH